MYSYNEYIYCLWYYNATNNTNNNTYATNIKNIKDHNHNNHNNICEQFPNSQSPVILGCYNSRFLYWLTLKWKGHLVHVNFGGPGFRSDGPTHTLASLMINMEPRLSGLGCLGEITLSGRNHKRLLHYSHIALAVSVGC